MIIHLLLFMLGAWLPFKRFQCELKIDVWKTSISKNYQEPRQASYISNQNEENIKVTNSTHRFKSTSRE